MLSFIKAPREMNIFNNNGLANHLKKDTYLPSIYGYGHNNGGNSIHENAHFLSNKENFIQHEQDNLKEMHNINNKRILDPLEESVINWWFDELTFGHSAGTPASVATNHNSNHQL